MWFVWQIVILLTKLHINQIIISIKKKITIFCFILYIKLKYEYTNMVKISIHDVLSNFQFVRQFIIIHVLDFQWMKIISNYF